MTITGTTRETHTYYNGRPWHVNTIHLQSATVIVEISTCDLALPHLGPLYSVLRWGADGRHTCKQYATWQTAKRFALTGQA